MHAFFRLALVAGALCAAFAASAQKQDPMRPSAPAAPVQPAFRIPQAAPAPVAPPAATSPTGTADADREAAGKAVAHGWLVLLDRKDWGTAWDTSSSLFRQTVPLGNWMDGIPKVRDPLGAFVARETVQSFYKTSLPNRPDGHYVTTNFATKFEKKAITEIVTAVLDTDGRWRVMGYEVR